MADRIINEKYTWDIDGDAALQTIRAITQELTDNVDALKKAKSASTDTTKASEALLDAEKRLVTILKQEATSVEGLAKKKQALASIQSTLTASQVKMLGLDKEIVKTNKLHAKAVADLAKNQGRLNESMKAGTTRLLAYVKGAAGLGALAAAFKLAVNEVTRLDAFIQSAQASFDGLTRAGAVTVAGAAEGTANFFRLDPQQLLDATATAAEVWEQSAAETLSTLSIGLISATSDVAREELLTQVREYSVQFREAGLSFAESISAINLADKLKTFTDKAADAIKEVNLKIGRQEKSTVEAIEDSLGKTFSDKLFSDLEKGLSTFEGFKRISEEIGKVDLNQEQYLKLIEGIGGGALEDAGRGFFEEVNKINAATATATDAFSKYQEQQLKDLEIAQQTSIARAQAADELTDLVREYNSATASTRLYITRGALELIKVLKQLPRFISENKTELKAMAAALLLVNTGNFIRGFRAITLAMKAQVVQARLLAALNPYQAAFLGVTALVAAISILTKTRSDEVRIADAVAASTKAVSEEYVNEKAQLDSLFKSLNDTNIKGKERQAVIDKIQENYGDYIGNIDLETASTKELAEAYNLANAGLLRNIIAQQQRARAAELIAQIADAQGELNAVTEQSTTLYERLKASAQNALNPLGVQLDATSRKQIELGKTITDNKDELSNLGKVGEEVFKNLLDVDVSFLSDQIDPPKVKKRVKDITDTTKKVEEAAKTLEERLAELGITIDKSFAASIENAGTDSEALLTILDTLETQLTSLDAEARKNATIETLPQLEALLVDIKAQKDAIDTARDIITRDGVTPELPTLDAGAVTSTGDAPELPVKFKIIQPDKKDIKDLVNKIVANTEEIFTAGFDLLNAIVDPQKQALDDLVDKQRDTISDMEANSEEYNARQFERENERLEKLEAEQRAAAERAANIAKVEVAAQALLSIAKAATLPFPLNIAAILATGAALVTGFAAANSATAGAFYDGTDSLQRPSGTPAGRDTIHIRADEGEMIIASREREKLNRAGITSRHEAVRLAIAQKLNMGAAIAQTQALGAYNMGARGGIPHGADMRKTEALLTEQNKTLRELVPERRRGAVGMPVRKIRKK